MKMSSLVDSAYRALVLRLQRGGTNARPVSRPNAQSYSWSFEVFTPGDERSTKVVVTVGILTKNVYKNDKVSVKVSEIHDIVPFREFTSKTGNCPPLDAVEAFVRKALAEKQALPAQSGSKKQAAPPPPPPAPAPLPVEVPVPVAGEQVDPPRRRKGRRHDAEPEQPPASEPTPE